VAEMGCEVTIIGRYLGKCCDSGLVTFKTKQFRMIFKKTFFFYMFFNIRLFIYLLFHKYNLLVSNDLDTLLPNYLVSRLKRIPLVYDSHEYFTGLPELNNRPFVKWVWRTLERIIFPRLSFIMTVSDSVAEQYESEYRIRPATIRNCSESSYNILPLSRSELGINPHHLLFIMQGAGINIDRGAEELIDAVGKIDNVSLIIAGGGDVYDILVEKVRIMNLTDRVKFLPLLPWEELMRYTKSADVGLTLDKNSNLNYNFSLPNKLFDYLSAGIPVIATDLKEISDILKKFSCGITIPKPDPEDISNAMKHLRDDSSFLSELKYNASQASLTVNWEHESEKVKDFYLPVLKTL
jgi:glycosyltransferase involved in cell wall biosynthesis